MKTAGYNFLNHNCFNVNLSNSAKLIETVMQQKLHWVKITLCTSCQWLKTFKVWKRTFLSKIENSLLIKFYFRI